LERMKKTILYKGKRKLGRDTNSNEMGKEEQDKTNSQDGKAMKRATLQEERTWAAAERR